MSDRVTTGPLDPAAIFAPLAEYGTVGLAVSGGGDSLALMLLAHRYAQDHQAPSFVVYSVDHGLRPEAAAEVAFVIAQATRLGFAARALRWDGTKPQAGLQEAARAARYGLIADAMREDGVHVLVTAHHRDDQAETVLMRLAHGSGLEGLRGMDYSAEIAGVSVVRPLLSIDPAELAAIVAASGLDAVADPSNDDTDYERVRWRKLMPGLAALGLDSARLGQLACRMRDADRALENMAAQAYALVAYAGEPVEARFERRLLQSIPRAIAVRLVGHVLARIGDARKSRALSAVEALTDRLCLEACRATLHGCIVSSEGAEIVVRPEPITGARARQRQQPAP